MRFAVAHKTSSYLMVLFAYLAMISGAAVPAPVALLGLVALAGSWWWEAPRVRIERWTIVWNLLSIVVLVWAVSTAVLTGDFLGVGGSFLTWLVVAKAFNRRTSRDWQQLYLLSFLMLIAGSVLNEDFTYGAAFLGFVVASTWALILSHLRREMEDNFLLKHADDKASERVEVKRILDSRRIVGGRFFAGTGAISIAVFVLSAAFFLTIPRVGAGFFMKQRKGQTYAGFSDSVKLGSGHGSIKDDDTVVMRVEILAPYRGRDAPYVHWRGVAFDQYNLGEWKRSPQAPRTELFIDREGTRERRLLRQHARDASMAELEAAVPDLVRHHVYLEPMETDVLFTASMPAAIDITVPLRRNYGPRQDRNDEIRFQHTGEIKYTAYSRIEPPSPDVLRAAPKQLPPGYQVFLQLPREITQRTRDLAAEITRGLTTDYDRATAIAAWLEENMTYTLELADPGDQEPIDFFLFDRKMGHCEYFASAFAILARAVGVPTRNVNGFLGGEWNEYYDYIAVRAGDAHSWDEVYFAGIGWVTFDPTPPSDQLGRGGDGLGARLGRLIDTLRFQWFKWVVDYDLGSQLAFFKDIGRWFKKVGRWFEARAKDAKAWAIARWYVVAPLGLLLLAWAIARTRKKLRERPPSERPRPRDRSPMAAIYARVLRRAARRGLTRTPSTTPRELARDAAARGWPGAAALGELTELYYAAEWGAAVTDDALARAQTLADEIETAAAAVPR